MVFTLSAQLSVHQQDVRGVASPRDNLILSSSRDGSAIIWHRDAPTTFNPVVALTASDAPTKYVNAVAYLPPMAGGPPEGYVVTGHQDGIVRVWAIDPNMTEPLHVLKGHTQDICSLHTLPDGTIISGSWDNTAKVWKDFKLAYDLKGHEGSVWAVLALGGVQFLTGSADKRIKFWREDRCTRTYTGHNGPVRGLVPFSDIGFASCSNDQNILLWTHEGDIISTLSGHSSFVYGIAMLPSGDIVSAGEDGTVRVFRDGELFQTIAHPCTSVWAISAMPSGDIVSGGSDGVVRVWSEASERSAGAEEIKALDDAVKESAKPQPDANDPLKDVETFPPEALNTPGTEQDENKIVLEQDGSAWAYGWDMGSFQWKKLGCVRSPPGKKLFANKFYDHVWEVDIADGQPKIQLPYNNGENPYTAAQRFIERNNLPLVYLDQVTNYIIQQAGEGAAAAMGGASEYQDPFTGAGSYRPAGSRPAAAASTYQDPFTGSGAYRPSPAPSTGGAGNYSDPFTGAGAYRPAAASPPPQTAFADPYTGGSRYTPVSSNPSSPPPVAPPTANVQLPYHNTTLYQSHTNPQALHNRLQDINRRLKEEPTTSGLALYPEEAAHIEQLVQHFSTRNGQPQIGSQHLETLIDLLTRWPADALLPIVDLTRLVAGAEPSIAIAQAPALIKALSVLSGFPSVEPSPRTTIAMLALRTFANMAPGATPGAEWVLEMLQLLLKIPYAQLNSQQRIALASVLSNLSVAAQTRAFGEDVLNTHAAVIRVVLETETTDAEVQYRVVMALGNMLYASRSRTAALTDAAALRTLVSASVNRIAAARPERRAVGESVLKLIGNA